MAGGTMCLPTAQQAPAASRSHASSFTSSSARHTDRGGKTGAGGQEGTLTLCKNKRGFGQVIFLFSLNIFCAIRTAEGSWPPLLSSSQACGPAAGLQMPPLAAAHRVPPKHWPGTLAALWSDVPNRWEMNKK